MPRPAPTLVSLALLTHTAALTAQQSPSNPQPPTPQDLLMHELRANVRQNLPTLRECVNPAALWSMRSVRWNLVVLPSGKIFFWGHSAGAAHTGDYIASLTNAGKKVPLAGAILTSGFYLLGPEVSVWKAYYGEDVSKYPERSSLSGLAKSKVPLLVVDAELDPDTFQPESDRLAQEREKAGTPG